MDKKLLGKRINMARKERGWTGERLAEACSINATYLRQIEAGSKVPSLPVFVSALSGAERLSNVSVGGGIAATGQSRHRCAAGVAASRHAEAVEHDGLHDSQRIGSIEGIAETRLKLRRVSTAFAGAGANSPVASDVNII